MPPKLAYLCLFENPTDEAGRALIRQFVLVREADRMGYDQIWIAEHHHDPVWPSAAVTTLLGYTAAATSHAKIGPLALVPSGREPEGLAEDLSTLDLLSKGRLQLAVSRCSPFDADAATRPPVIAPTQALLQRMRGQDGAKPALAPLMGQAEPAVWVATSDEDSIRAAARAGWGLVAGATASEARIERMLAVYREARPDGDPRLLLVRFAMTAPEAAEAEAVAGPYLEAFAQRMRALGVREHPGETLTFDVAALQSASLVGSHEDNARRMRAWGERWGVHAVAIVPTSAQFDTAKHCLADFVDEVRPLLSDD